MSSRGSNVRCTTKKKRTRTAGSAKAVGMSPSKRTSAGVAVGSHASRTQNDRIKLPKQVMVNGTYYKVVRKALLDNDDVQEKGETDKTNAVISLSTKLKGECLMATLRHEIAHAVWVETGIERDLMEVVAPEMLYKLEEHFINRFVAAYEGIVRLYNLR